MWGLCCHSYHAWNLEMQSPFNYQVIFSVSHVYCWHISHDLILWYCRSVYMVLSFCHILFWWMWFSCFVRDGCGENITLCYWRWQCQQSAGMHWFCGLPLWGKHHPHTVPSQYCGHGKSIQSLSFSLCLAVCLKTFYSIVAFCWGEGGEGEGFF